MSLHKDLCCLLVDLTLLSLIIMLIRFKPIKILVSHHKLLVDLLVVLLLRWPLLNLLKILVLRLLP